MSTNPTEHSVSYAPDKHISYLDSGPRDGPLIIFSHGWPGCAEVWSMQASHFNRLGLRTISVDQPGYGNSSTGGALSDYRLETLVSALHAVYKASGAVAPALWIGHDWGATIVWSVAAHHPDICAGVACVAVPYMTLELGLQGLRETINRDLYPADEHPNGPWDYQAYYETNFEDATRGYEADVAAFTKAVHVKGNPEALGKPAPTAGVSKEGGRFGPGAILPAEDAIPMKMTVFDGKEWIWDLLRAKMLKTGYRWGNAYYMNHGVNRAYTLEKSVNGGVLEMPTLFINAKWDSVCSSDASPKLPVKMREFCKGLTEVDVDAGHHAQLERYEDVNRAIEGWLRGKLSGWYDGTGVKL
ncbi:alpha/beta-hydrolase [Pseudovirgaria hyperparasitica]|uniref:Alpha/beta-hydrolase n=1 Tax=Pseudovirgaria hyperparasitica TaxID=470096 RepID=A0A6A6W2Y2_9PEZI|nr:alpha/beta-hydrolase [Pseudovirgaria hyperparasitica]KAF2756374.1 alpha/beta-hydrolase [Pseudovirgaria hyperparasitica]